MFREMVASLAFVNKKIVASDQSMQILSQFEYKVAYLHCERILDVI